jgi:N utilization substance protein A
VSEVAVDEKGHTLNVVVPDDQLSLSIGKKGRNARLASKLVGWRVDIRSQSEVAKEAEKRKELQRKQLRSLLALPGVGEKMAERLAEAGFDSLEKVSLASAEALLTVKGIGEKRAEKLISASLELLASERKSKEAGESS